MNRGWIVCSTHNTIRCWWATWGVFGFQDVKNGGLCTFWCRHGVTQFEDGAAAIFGERTKGSLGVTLGHFLDEHPPNLFNLAAWFLFGLIRRR